MIDRAQITGIILCGGEGTRMGGIDKPLALLGGRPLVAHVVERLAPQVGRTVISANRSLDTYREFSETVVTDTVPGLGPLGGLLSALAQVATPWFFCCPGDVPLLNDALVSRLAAVPDGDLRIPFDGERQQLLFMLGRTDLRADLDAYLAAGARSVHGLLDRQRLALVDMTDIADSFVNINSAAELLALDDRLR